MIGDSVPQLIALAEQRTSFFALLVEASEDVLHGAAKLFELEEVEIGQSKEGGVDVEGRLIFPLFFKVKY